MCSKLYLIFNVQLKNAITLIRYTFFFGHPVYLNVILKCNPRRPRCTCTDKNLKLFSF